MDPRRLWAKSKRDDEAATGSMLLPGHLRDVHAAAERVLDSTADAQLNALGLDAAVCRERLWLCVRLAAAVHDLGKANDHFQGMVRNAPERSGRPQGLRHEWVTVLMMRRLRDWLLPAVGGNETDFAVVEWAVAGHHPGHDSPPKGPPPGAGVEIELLTAHPDFRAAIDWLGATFGFAAPALAGEKRGLTGSNSVFEDVRRWARDARRRWDDLGGPARKLVAAVKNALVAADVAGSALAKRTDAPDWDWITKSFADRPTAADLHSVVDTRLGGSAPRPFQAAVAGSVARATFVKAGCGSGKTLAAYMWAAKNHPTRRLFFCYPTTGTTESSPVLGA